MGAGILAVQAAVLILLVIFLRRRGFHTVPFQDFLFAGGKVPHTVLTLTSFANWMWTTSILGATEAGITYGLLGCVSYAVGASFGFAMTLGLLRYGRRHYGRPFFLSDLARDRLSRSSEYFFLGIGVLMAAYTMVQQLVGVANVFSMLWNCSYKFFSVLLVLGAALFVLLTGMRGVLLHDLIGCFTILLTLAALLFLMIFGGEAHLFQEGLGMALTDFRTSTRGGALSSFLAGLCFYMLVMIILGVSETLLDPVFALRVNLMEDADQAVSSVRMGCIWIWTPVVVITSCVLCCVWRARMGGDLPEGLSTNLMVEVLFSGVNSFALRSLFSCLMLAIAFTTVTNSLMGVFALMSLRGHSLVTGEEGTPESHRRFGSLFLLMFALFCGLIVLSLDNISLFRINIVCGIFFAAPCGILLFCRGIPIRAGRFPILAAIVGVVVGVLVWMRVEDSQYSLLFGAMASFLIPAILIGFSQPLRLEHD